MIESWNRGIVALRDTRDDRYRRSNPYSSILVDTRRYSPILADTRRYSSIAAARDDRGKQIVELIKRHARKRRAFSPDSFATPRAKLTIGNLFRILRSIARTSLLRPPSPLPLSVYFSGAHRGASLLLLAFGARFGTTGNERRVFSDRPPCDTHCSSWTSPPSPA